MRTSHSHETLLTCPTSLHTIDLSMSGVVVRPVHNSILSKDNCFVVCTGNELAAGSKYYCCSSDVERQQWLRWMRHSMNPMREKSYRTDNSLRLFILEAKNLPAKKKYFCELLLDQVLFARTSSKQMADMLFWGEQFLFGDLSDVVMVTINIYREADKKKKKEKHFLLGYVNINSSDISSRQLCERWYPVSSAVVGKSGKESRMDSALVRVKARYQSVNILPMDLYQPLIAYIRDEYSPLVDILEPCISVKAKEEIAACLVSLLHCTGNVNDFLCDIVMTEVDRLENDTLALRGNSIATKAVEAYMKLVGQKYLLNTLSDVVKTVIEPSTDCEVDPSKVLTGLAENRNTLVQHCSMVWFKIVNSYPMFPFELKRLFQAIRNNCRMRSHHVISQSMCDQLVSSCVFLRFFCPAILSPSLFNITQEFPNERGARNLTLIAKTIQGLANFTKFVINLLSYQISGSMFEAEFEP
jgi:hypothetical protein